MDARESESRRGRKRGAGGRAAGRGWRSVERSANFPFISSLIIFVQGLCAKGGVCPKEVRVSGRQRPRSGTSLERKSVML